MTRAPARAGDGTLGTDAFQQLLGTLDSAQQARFARGKRLFESDWAIADAPDGLDGLGPLFSRLSCDGCHTRAGRGEPPRRPDFPMISMTVRLSVPGTGPDGGPKPDPHYGDQLDRNAVAGVPVEGRPLVSYTEQTGHYGDGAPYSLRIPHYHITGLVHGSLGDGAMISARVAPALAGLGLLDAVPDDAIRALAVEEARAGQAHGRPNLVWDIAAGKLRAGHLGWKAGQPGLRQQNANAFNREIGITNPLYPSNDCTPVETACLAAARAAPRHPKIAADFLDAVTFYLSRLAPPRARRQENPRVRQGAALFARAGCAACHRPTLETGDSPDPALAHKTIHPYSDLLLHDMGEGLADGRPEFRADGRSWRTAPLWGLGLIEAVNGHDFLLHDGRARGPAEAILWHGGEAEAAKQAFRAMTRQERAALLAFLESL
jgi:CxxC motif-containing protein (DUF1111 family)